MMLKKWWWLAMVLFACGESEVIDGAELETVNQEIVDNLLAAGYPESEIEVGDDGVVIVGGDAVVTLQASREMIGLDGHEEHAGEIQFRQYRTTNLVDPGIAVDLHRRVELLRDAEHGARQGDRHYTS